MKLTQVLDVLRTLAPERLAEPWDAVGLQLGEAGQRVKRGLLCIDLTEPVLAEAIRQKADLVVAYHPPIFKPLAALTEAEVKQRIVLRAARAGMAIYSPHTALDAAEGGVNDWLARGVGEGDVRPIRPAELPASGADHRIFELVVFTPKEDVDRFRAKLSDAGAGVIGHYSQCSFNLLGEGTFLGDVTTHPTVGEANRLERVPEVRLEMIVPANRLADAVQVVRAEHPYEEPAFYIFPLHAPEQVSAGAAGQGRVVTLRRPVKLATLVSRLKKHLGVKHLEVATADGADEVQRVGLCAGAGGSLLAEAGDVDVFFTGEMRHHDVLSAVASGVSVVLAGHTQTERPYLPVYRERIIAAGADAVQWQVSEADGPLTALR